MCAAKQYAVNQHPQFARNQCAIKQYVYQYKEWQCVWNQHGAKQNAAELSLAPNQFVAQQYNHSQHAAEKHPQQDRAVNKMEQYTLNQDAAQQYDLYHHNEEENHLNHGAVEPIPIPHDVVEQYAQDVCDWNQYTNDEDYHFNQYAAQQYLVEQFPRNCYAGDECVEEDVLNQFTTEQYALNPYFVEECHGMDYELKQLEVDNYATEQYNPSQYVEKRSTAYHQFADEQYSLNQNATEQYEIDQYTDHWYSLNQYDEAQNFMYNYSAEQCEIEDQYQNAAQQFAYGHYAMNYYTPEQYILDQSDPTQAAVGQNPANLIAFPHAQQFVTVQCAPYQYAVGQYFSDHYGLAEQYFPQQYRVNQYPENVYVDHYAVKQHTAVQYRGDMCPLNQWPSGRIVYGQYETQHCVTEHDTAKLQAAVQCEAQQHALKYYGLDQHALEPYALNQFEAEQCSINQYATQQYVLNQFKAKQRELNQYFAEQYAINHQQHGLNQNAADQYRVGRNSVGQNKTKRGVTNNLRAKQCSMNKRMSDICSADQCPTQQDANTQIEEKPGATEHETNQDNAELRAAKHYCKGKEAADRNVATQEATQLDSAKPSVAEQDLNDEENQVLGLESPDVVGTSSTHLAKTETKESDVGIADAATVHPEVEQDVQSEVATEQKAPSCSSLSHVAKNQCLSQPNGTNHHNALAQSKAAQLTTNDMGRPCAIKECSAGVEEAGVEEPPVDSAEKNDQSLEVTDCKISRQSTTPSNTVTEWGDCCLDASEVIDVDLDSPQQKRDDPSTAKWVTEMRDTPVQDGTELNTTEIQSTGQDALPQTAIQLNVLEWDTARQTSSGCDLVEPDAAKQNSAEQHALQYSPDLDRVLQETFMPVSGEQDKTKQQSTGSYTPEQPITDAEQDNPGQDSAVEDPAAQVIPETFEAKQSVTEQHGTILDATERNSTQPGASDLGSTVEAPTRADDADLNTVGPQETPEGNEASTQGTAKQEPPDHNPVVAEQSPSQNLRDMNPPMMFSSDEDSAERYFRRGTRSCKTGCSRALFNKGQSSKSRYYSRNHYSTRYCYD